jgi:hypothetical protein
VNSALAIRFQAIIHIYVLIIRIKTAVANFGIGSAVLLSLDRDELLGDVHVNDM